MGNIWMKTLEYYEASRSNDLNVHKATQEYLGKFKVKKE
jgi:hypothetical protein